MFVYWQVNEHEYYSMSIVIEYNNSVENFTRLHKTQQK